MSQHNPYTGEVLDQIDIEDILREPSARQRFLDAHGRELLDPTPVAPPIGYKRQPSLSEQIRQMVRSERLRAEADAAGMETFEEADDFDVEDYDPTVPFESDFDPSSRDALLRAAHDMGYEVVDRSAPQTAGQGAAQPPRATLDPQAAPQATPAPVNPVDGAA